MINKFPDKRLFVKLPAILGKNMTDRPTDQPTERDGRMDRQTDVRIGNLKEKWVINLQHMRLTAGEILLI